MQKVTKEQKAKIRELRAEGLSYREISEKLGVGAHMAQYWSKRKSAKKYANPLTGYKSNPNPTMGYNPEPFGAWTAAAKENQMVAFVGSPADVTKAVSDLFS